MAVRLYHDDCLSTLKTLADNSVDAVVTDPPYGLSFMGKKWDYDVPNTAIWSECLRVLKPGGHLLAFAGTRTQHRMAVNIEDAGFEIRDMIAWVYGSGFPKSLDVSKAIDKAAGAEREVLSVMDPRGAFDGRERNSAAINTNWRGAEGRDDVRDLSKKEITAPATDAARQWSGWGTALKPALEPITVARKPLSGTVAETVLAYGTGALNIDACRVPTDSAIDDPRLGGHGSWSTQHAAKNVYTGSYAGVEVGSSPLGRWPANLIHDGSDEVVRVFPESNGSGVARTLKRGTRDDGWGMSDQLGELRDAGTGTAARFFYCPKASKADRERGVEDLAVVSAETMVERTTNSTGINSPSAGAGRNSGSRNPHPTVKPIALMRYLIRLVTPPAGIVLDPFMGSGTTGLAAQDEGMSFIGIERERTYFELASRRLTTTTETTAPAFF